MRHTLARLLRLEQRSKPAGEPVIIFTIRDGSEMRASISSPNSEPTPAAVAVRAELEAQGYVVAPGYDRGNRRGKGSHPPSGELWRIHHEIIGPSLGAAHGN